MPREIMHMQNSRWSIGCEITAAVNAMTAADGGVGKLNAAFAEHRYRHRPRCGRNAYFQSRENGDNTMEIRVYFGFFMEDIYDPEDAAQVCTDIGFVFNMVGGQVNLESIAIPATYGDPPRKDTGFLAYYLMTSLETVAYARQRDLADLAAAE